MSWLMDKVAKLPVVPSPTLEQQESAAKERFNRERYERLADLVSQAGSRYEFESLKTFRATCKEQRDVLSVLREHAAELSKRNVVLYGSCGTGKDHLLFGCARVAINYGHSVRWVTGPEIYLGSREAIRKDSSQEAYVRRFTEPDVLVLSDPVPAVGDLTDWNRTLLFLIIDRRYRYQRPTWMSLNVSSRGEAEKLLGPPVADRLRHDGLLLYCNWPSYRR